MTAIDRQLHLPITSWAHGWGPDNIVLAAHASFIPELPPDDVALVRTDGLWGPHDWSRFPQPFDPSFPYLAWIRLPDDKASSSVFYRLPTRADLRPHDMHKSRVVLSRIWIDELTEARDDIQSKAQHDSSLMKENPAMHNVTYPSTASRRITAAIMRLKDAPCLWRDIVKCVRAVQRHLLELQAFCDWFRCITLKQHMDADVITRGSICTDFTEFRMLQSNNVTAFLRLPISQYYPPDPNNQTRLLRLIDWCNFVGMEFAEWRDEGVPAGSVQEHTKDLWYYPPPRPRHQLFELTARGYAPRTDTENLTKKASGIQMYRQQAIAHERNVINASRPKNTQSSRRILNMIDRPEWVQATIAIWDPSKSNTAPIFTEHNLKRGWSFHLPPIHLFWGPSDEKTRETFFYHWHCLSRPWRCRHMFYRDLALSPSEWRSILGDAHWKREWAKKSPEQPYDSDRFWSQGSEFAFGSMSSNTVATGAVNRPLSCGCSVDRQTSYDPVVRTIILYKLNMAHIFWEFEHHDELQISAAEWDEDRRGRRAEERKKVWPYGPDYEDIPIEYEYGCQKQDWRARLLWFENLRVIMSTWKGFPDELNRTLLFMRHEDFAIRESMLVKFYNDSFISTHGTIPSLPMRKITEHPPKCTHGNSFFR